MFLTLCWSLQYLRFVVLDRNYNYLAFHFVNMFLILSGAIEYSLPPRGWRPPMVRPPIAADGKAADGKATPPQPDSRQFIGN